MIIVSKNRYMMLHHNYDRALHTHWGDFFLKEYLTENKNICFWRKTRVIIKISNHSCYTRNFDWFSWGWSKNAPLILIFFCNNLEIGSWISRINQCEGHQCGSTYMVVMLSDSRYKAGKNSIFCVFGLF